MAIELKAVLRLTDKFTDRMRRVAGDTERFRKLTGQTSSAVERLERSGTAASAALGRMSSSGGKAFAKVQSGAASVATSIASATVKTTALGASIAAIGAGAGIYSLSKAALKLSTDAELANIAFETLLKSPEKAAAFQEDLKKMAADTPFDLPGLRDSSRKLLAFGFEVERVLPMLTSLGDASAGLGLGKEGIDRLTVAMGQMRAKGRVQGDEMLQLMEAGIPALEILAEKAGVTQMVMSEMISDGIVPADKAIKALLEGIDKRFGGLMDKQAKSLAGMYAKMKDVWENDLLKRWGDGLAKALYPRFQRITKWLDDNEAAVEKWGENFARIAERTADKLLRAFEGAYKYVRTQYLDNPRFQNLSVEGKVAFVIDDLLTKFNQWLASDGGQQIKTATEKVVSVLATSLDVAAGPLASVAYKVGTSLAAGVIDGFQKTLAEHPFLATVAGAWMGGKAGSAFGPWGIAVGAAAGAATGLGGSIMAGQAVDRKAAEAALNDPNSIYNRVTQGPQGTYGFPVQQPNDGSVRVDFAGATRRYNGLDYVPRDNYPIIAHKGEKLLNSSEAKESRRGGGNVTVNLTVNYSGERLSKRDAEEVAYIIVREMEALP